MKVLLTAQGRGLGVSAVGGEGGEEEELVSKLVF